jgi:hypothetical protein
MADRKWMSLSTFLVNEDIIPPKKNSNYIVHTVASRGISLPIFWRYKFVSTRENVSYITIQATR